MAGSDVLIFERQQWLRVLQNNTLLNLSVLMRPRTQTDPSVWYREAGYADGEGDGGGARLDWMKIKANLYALSVQNLHQARSYWRAGRIRKAKKQLIFVVKVRLAQKHPLNIVSGFFFVLPR